MPAPRPQRYRPHKQIRIPEAVARELKRLARDRSSNMTAQAVELIREGLERLGRWPPPPEPPGL
jgi:hypothetical protein